LTNLDTSQQILTISIRLDNLNKNLKMTKSQLNSLDFKNLDGDKKSLSRQSRKSRHFFKVHLNRSRNLDLDLDSSQLLRPPGLDFLNSIY